MTSRPSQPAPPPSRAEFEAAFERHRAAEEAFVEAARHFGQTVRAAIQNGPEHMPPPSRVLSAFDVDEFRDAYEVYMKEAAQMVRFVDAQMLRQFDAVAWEISQERRDAAIERTGRFIAYAGVYFNSPVDGEPMGPYDDRDEAFCAYKGVFARRLEGS